mmetsp:Transcript_45336/g.95116  ORF Transcript_45336/g.95116 Transcript_45336/m.95116 type:complete len:611 (+) Transcript_45336:120-1952(+)
MAEAIESSRAPIYLPTYSLGDEGKPDHFTAATSREVAAVEAKSLIVSDAAFIKRSDLKWTYAIVSEKVEAEGEATVLRFEVDKDKNRKSFPEAQWGKYIRVVKIEDAEMARLKEEAKALADPVAEEKPDEKPEEAAKPEEAPKEEAAAAEKEGSDAKSLKSSSSKKSSGGKSTGGSSWFSGLFDKKSKDGNNSKKADDSESVEDVTPIAEITAPAVAPAAEPVAEEPVASASKEEAQAEEAPKEETQAEEASLGSKENSDPIKLTPPAVFLPSDAKPPLVPSSNSSASSKDQESTRTPLNLKSSLGLKKKRSIVKLFKKDKTPKQEEKKTIEVKSSPVPAMPAAVKSPKAEKKEWFDPEACEVDYDKNPTDLFQALEARQFSYAEEMFKQVNLQFNKECKTWVVARGQKKKETQLRFRALPLHAALVFGAPDDMTLKILNAYPKATRGRDVKGRLPIHLAMEHNVSDDILIKILEAFPKGFFAKDKKDMTPLDYVNENMDRCHMKRYIPMLMGAKLEEERAKWENEKEEALVAQKDFLKTDPVYMSDVVEKVTEEVENTYATKIEMLEANYQKEIQLLKKRHDSETQALLEGFEVKLNFERKLQKLKAKA